MFVLVSNSGGIACFIGFVTASTCFCYCTLLLLP